MPSLAFILLVVCTVLVLAPNGAYAFGAGNIPSFAYLEGKAFRHGDIEDILAELLKRTSGSLMSKGAGTFNNLDVKRVYFGNWLRDYSQAIDLAGLKATSLQNILNVVMVLGFLAHGYATEEFQVTLERLGVYLPVEHIDNPKGYGMGEDARNYHPKLRGPVDPRELEVDMRTGMKNYIANTDGGWDTSKAHVIRTLVQAINLGRQYRAGGSKNKAEQYEAFRLLGTALHTLEDFPAHSNFCELALQSLGWTNVFAQVGDQVRLQAPNGRSAPPLVTGTFGGDDFIHSLLGEATDHISQASVSDINEEVENAKVKLETQDVGSPDKLKFLLGNIPSSDNQQMQNDVDKISQKPTTDPNQMSAQELNQHVWAILLFRDSLVKKIGIAIEKIPGLSNLLDTLTENIAVFVFTALEPYLKPILQVATDNLGNASTAVLQSQDQEEVFRDPYASDPTHSYLSKDHFNLILNEPAGNLAKLIVIHVVIGVTNAWDNTSINPHQVAESACECMFHPDWVNRNSNIQRQMMDYMRDWVNGLGHSQHEMIGRLSKESVKGHQNIRREGDLGSSAAVRVPSTSAQAAGNTNASSGNNMLDNVLGKVPGFSAAQSILGKVGIGNTPGGQRDAQGSYGGGGYNAYQSPPSHISPPVQHHGSGYGPPGGAPYGHGASSTGGYPPISGPVRDTSSEGRHYGAAGFPAPGAYPGHKEEKHKKDKKDKKKKKDKHGYSDDDDDDDSDDDGKKHKKDKKKKDKGGDSAGSFPGAAYREGHGGGPPASFPAAPPFAPPNFGPPGGPPPGHPGAYAPSYAPPPPHGGAPPYYGGGAPPQFPNAPPPGGGFFPGAPGFPNPQQPYHPPPPGGPPGSYGGYNYGAPPPPPGAWR